MAILFLILFHGIFLKSILCSKVCLGTAMLNIVLIALWSNPYSVLYTVYFTIVDASLSDAKIRLIVILQLPFCHVFVPLGSRLRRE